MANDSSATLNFSHASPTELQRYDILIHVIAHLIISTLGIAANVFILVVLRSHKDLQSPCFLLIGGECVFTIALGIGMLASQILNTFHLATNTIPIYSRIVCFLSKGYLIATCIESIGLITVFIGLDRLISIVCPLVYGRLGKRYAYTCGGFCAAYGLISSLGGLEGIGLSESVDCSGLFNGFGRRFTRHYAASNFFLATVSVFIYAAMLAAFVVRRRQLVMKAMSGGNNLLSVFLKHQSSAMPVINLLMICYITTAAFPELVITVVPACAKCAPYFNRISHYASVIKGLSMFSEILALSVGSRVFRECAKKKMVCWK